MVKSVVLFSWQHRNCVPILVENVATKFAKNLDSNFYYMTILFATTLALCFSECQLVDQIKSGWNAVLFHTLATQNLSVDHDFKWSRYRRFSQADQLCSTICNHRLNFRYKHGERVEKERNRRSYIFTPVEFLGLIAITSNKSKK